MDSTYREFKRENKMDIYFMVGVIIEVICILDIFLMKSIKTERGTNKELLHSQLFDKGILTAIFTPILLSLLSTFIRNGLMIVAFFLVFFAVLYIVIFYWDTVTVKDLHNKWIAKQKKKIAHNTNA